MILSHLLPKFSMHLDWHPSRLTSLIHMCQAMILRRGVQHWHLAGCLGTSINAAVRRVERLFAKQTFDGGQIATLIVSFLGLQGGLQGPLQLLLDRTNWRFGKANINFLVLAVVVRRKTAIPLFWTALSKKGTSNTQERIDLIQRFIKTFGVERIGCLIADREFIGDSWLQSLQGIPFYIRFKENQFVDFGVESCQLKEFFAHLKGHETSLLIQKQIGTQTLSFAGTRSKKGELVIIGTNQLKKAPAILRIYRDRWGVETMFCNSKTKGFNLEDTHMTYPERLEKLLAIMALGMMLCIKMGLEHEKKIPFRRTFYTSLYSLFSWGFSLLITCLANLNNASHHMPPQKLARKALQRDA